MTNYLTLSVSFFVIAIAICIVYFSVLLYQNSRYPRTERNSLRNSYGYEFYASEQPATRGILYTLMSMDIVSLCLGFFFCFLTDKSLYSYMLSAVFIISLICICAANMIPLSHPIAHLVTAFTGMGFMGVGTFLLAFSDMINDGLFHLVDMGLGVSITMGIIGGIMIVALFNPKLRDWAKLDRTEVDGVTVYEKPKINWLALYEWISIILCHVIGLILFINLVVTGQVG